MMKKLVLLFAVIFAFSFDTFAQSRKKVVNLGIESVTEVKVDYEESNGNETIRNITIFDNKGNVIEEKEYDKTGKLEKRTTYEYNQDNDKIKETRYKANNKVEEILTYKYENELIVERCKYDASKRLISKKKYIYKFRDQ